jgi:hypothetical protein
MLALRYDQVAFRMAGSANRSPGGPYRYVFYRFLTGALAPPSLTPSGKVGQCDFINLI